MDSLTQFVLGAGIQSAMLGRVQQRKAVLYGGVLATLPDLDVLIRYADPVSNMTYHRGATHSLIYLSALAFLLTAMIRRFRPNPHYSTRWLLLTVWLVLVTHPLLDAMTVYGTQLFYPFAPTPVSYAAVFIVDPLFTLPLLLACLAISWRGVHHHTHKATELALILGVTYLAFGVLARMTAETRVEAALNARGVTVTAIKGVPLPVNNVVWRVLAKSEDGRLCEGVSSLFDRRPAETTCDAPLAKIPPSVTQHALYQRLSWFTDGWLRHDAVGDEWVVSDMRMGTHDEQYFRFVLARRNAQGQWQANVPYRYRAAELSYKHLRLLPRVWRRIWWQQPSLLAQDEA